MFQWLCCIVGTIIVVEVVRYLKQTLQVQKTSPSQLQRSRYSTRREAYRRQLTLYLRQPRK